MQKITNKKFVKILSNGMDCSFDGNAQSWIKEGCRSWVFRGLQLSLLLLSLLRVLCAPIFQTGYCKLRTVAHQKWGTQAYMKI